MNNLFNKMFGKDALSYEFYKGLKQVVISPDCLPFYQYDHALWEQLFPTVLTSFTSLLEAGLLAGMDCGLCGCSSKEVKLVKTVGKSCSHSA